ncbi:MAG: right-handed parallel beta-helix repeat-containing protein, partial [Rhizobiaceae bacterium]|nr:right-handed parallel beta-helix repeat-containing protein [Rhizobiaceae bacterium]
MALFTVSNTNDSGAGSLRQAVIDANTAAGADTIQFDPSLAFQTIKLTSGELAIRSDITINGDTDGDRKANITISGDDAHRIFNMNLPGAVLTVRSLTLTDGSEAFGGAILNSHGTTLVVIDSTIKDSAASVAGGGIASGGTMTVINSTITGNTAGAGGGIFVENNLGGQSAAIINTTIHDNEAVGGFNAGGGLSAQNTGTVTISNTTISGNSAAGAGGGIDLFGSSTLTIRNSVVADNAGSSGADIGSTDNSGTINAASNVFGTTVNLVGTYNGNLENTDPMLGDLADNGGPAMTRLPLVGSPLISAGNATLLPADTFNLDGNAGTTVLPQDATGGARVIGSLDIGAAEARDFVVTTLLDVVNAGDGVLSLREAVTLANTTTYANITFAAGLSGTIELTGELALTSSVTINGDTNGDRKADITISGMDTHRIFNTSGANTSVQLHSLTLTDGATTGAGGAIQALGGPSALLSLVDSTIRDSNATIDGGGIHSEVTLFLHNSLVTGNSSNFGGGILIQAGLTIGMSHTTIHGNHATADGGGIDTGGDNLVNIYNSTITNNTAGGTGGGIDLLDGSRANVVSSVVAGNTAGTSGADIGETGTDSDLHVESSLFSTTPSIDSFTPGTTFITGADPRLGPLADNGGPVLTRTPLNGSLLISAGGTLRMNDSTDVDGDGNTAEDVPFDAAGNPRVIGTLDIGAVEFAPPVIGGGATATVAENSTAVTTVIATDPTGQLLNYSIFGGADAAKFGINATTGALAFLAAPDFESPSDAGGNNIYDVIVRARDASGLTADKAIAVTVTDVADTPARDATPPGGGDSHTLPSGGTVSGTAAQLFGDTVSGLGTTGTIRFTDSVTKLSDLIISGNEVRLASAGPNSAPLTLQGDFSDGRFFVVKNAAGGSD